jgi:hypothetical protein
MLKKLFKPLLVVIACMPVCLWADDSMCAGQSYSSLLTQCVTTEDACVTIIKNNCFSNSPQTAALQLAQITDALAQQYTLQVATPSDSKIAPIDTQTMDQAVNTNNLGSSSLSAPQEQKQTAQGMAEQPSPSKNKSNYWF